MAKEWASKKVPEYHYRCIDNAMGQDDKLTASSLKDILNKRFGAENVKYGTRTIARIRNEFGWTFMMDIHDIVRQFEMPTRRSELHGVYSA